MISFRPQGYLKAIYLYWDKKEIGAMVKRGNGMISSPALQQLL
ncbi:hypothetical protein [Scytonema sp. NUACC21]